MGSQQKTKRGVSMGSQQGAKRGKWLKRISIVIVVLLSVLLLLPQAGKYARYRSKENIKSLVINNLVFLDAAGTISRMQDAERVRHWVEAQRAVEPAARHATYAQPQG